MDNESLNNLLLALSGIQFEAAPEFQYRVYYDVLNKECTYKTINNDEGTNYIVVTKEEYEAIDFCPSYYVDIENKLQKKEIDFSKKLRLHKSEVGFRTIKGNNIFIVDKNYTNKTDTWGYKTS
jgi:hypothetical protein